MFINKALAADFDLGKIFNPIGYGGNSDSPDVAGFNLETFIRNLIGFATIVAGLIFLGYLIIGGIKYATSGGDKMATESARNTITNALIGLVIVVSAIFIIAIVQAVLGLNILHFTIKGP